MGSSTKQATSTSSSAPWDAQQPYIKEGMTEAKKLYDQAGPAYFSGSTVAGFSPEQQQAQALGTARATGGNEGMKIGQQYNNDVLQGKYLNSNPYSDTVFQNMQQKVMPSIASQFSGSGRYGSDQHADTASRAMTEAYSPYAAQQYNNGLAQMDAAANRAPTYAANDYADISALNDIGTAKQGLAQNETQDALNRFNYYRDLPQNKLNQYMSTVSGNYGSNQTSTTPYQQPSIWGQIAGGGLGLLGLLG